MNRFRGASRSGATRGSAGRTDGRGGNARATRSGPSWLRLAALACTVITAASGLADAGVHQPASRRDSQSGSFAPASSSRAASAVHASHARLSPDSLRALATLDSLASLAEGRFVGIQGPLGGMLFRVGRLYRAEVVRKGYQLDVGLYDFRLHPLDADGGASLYLVFPNNKLIRAPLATVSPTMRGRYVHTLDQQESALFDRYGRVNGMLHAEIGTRVENARFSWRVSPAK